MDQVGRESALELGQSLPRYDQLVDAAAPKRRPKWKAVNWNPLVLSFAWEISGILSCHYNDLMAALSQGYKELAGKHFGTAYIGPKEL
jgi:hypothetical protein